MPTTWAAAPRATASCGSPVVSRPSVPYAWFMLAFTAVPTPSTPSAKFVGDATAATGIAAAASAGASVVSSESPWSGLSARPLRSSQRPSQPTCPASLSSPTS